MKKKVKKTGTYLIGMIVCAGILALGIYYASTARFFSVSFAGTPAATSTKPIYPPLDILAYNQKMVFLAGYGTTSAATGISATSSLWIATSSSIFSLKNPWPVSTVYPLGGALLPFDRIVAYYGNFDSAQMGILGALPTDQMISQLEGVAAEWQAADPSTTVIPALDYIAVTAQGSPGADGKYRLRMPADQIDEAISLADSMHGVVFLDIQPGLSNLETEIPLLATYLEKPEVELAIDPEFSMEAGGTPGSQIGTMSSSDVNYAAEYLAHIVTEYDLPPKILLVHRFTEDMVTGAENIRPLPQVQIVMNMDGWSTPEKKENVYRQVITDYPVQFSGIKLFYKNDALPPSTGLLTPAQVLSLHSAPSFVEYQ